MVVGTWTDAVISPQGSPAGRSAPGGELIGSPETREAANKLAQAESEFKAYPSVLALTHDADEYKRTEQAYHDAQVAYFKVMAAAAAYAAAAATPSHRLILPLTRPDTRMRLPGWPLLGPYMIFVQNYPGEPHRGGSSSRGSGASYGAYQPGI